MSNYVNVCGVITGALSYYGNYGDLELYKTEISAKRISGVIDTIPILIPAHLTDGLADGITIEVVGEYQSENKQEDGKRRLMLQVFAKKLKIADEQKRVNHIRLKGTICRKEKRRTTPLGRIIENFMIAENGTDCKSNYIPCIIWEKNVDKIDSLKVGDEVFIKGRIQSRIYEKRLKNGEVEARTAYEVSVSFIEEVHNA